MTSDSRKITVFAVVVVLLLAVGLGVSVYYKKKQRELRNVVAVLLKDAGSRMRDALGIEAAPPTMDRARFLKQVEAHAATAERNYLALRRLDSAWDRALVSAADDYLLTSREILKRQAASHRHRRLLTESALALREHMRVDNRTGAWVTEAVKLKERAEKDYRDYRIAVGAYAKLLDEFPASQEKIARYVQPTLIIENTAINNARHGAREIEKQATTQIEQLRQMHAAR